LETVAAAKPEVAAAEVVPAVVVVRAAAPVGVQAVAPVGVPAAEKRRLR
jgi:hypothetical protein